MRRKREKTTSTKVKASPERKTDKLRRTKSKRRKQSTSESDSGEEAPQVPEVVSVTELNAGETSNKEDSPEDSHDQVWQVKTAETSTDSGEIHKLKICLTRPPSTPDSGDRSPKSGVKKRHGRTASFSDSASIEGSDERKKSKHRSRRSICETSEVSEQPTNPLPIEPGQESNLQEDITTEANNDAGEKSCKEMSKEQLSEKLNVDKRVKEPTVIDTETIKTKENSVHESCKVDKPSDEDTNKDKKFVTNEPSERVISPETERRMSIDKSEILEIHAEESKGDISHETIETLKEDVSEDHKSKEKDREINKKEVDTNKEQGDTDKKEVETNKEQGDSNKKKGDTIKEEAETNKEKRETNKEEVNTNKEKEDTNKQDGNINKKGGDTNKKEGDTHKEGGDTNKEEVKVSRNEDVETQESVIESTKPQNEILSINETDVVAITENSSSKVMDIETLADSEKKILENSESAQSSNEDTMQNGHTNIVINRKRRWGSRPNKLSTQKSITISTDVLKEIIPDVKLVEFEEVIEDKKPPKREVVEKVERPVLPKIVIDNTVNVDFKRDKENEQLENIKHKEVSILTTNRKISIVKETDDNPITRPPSPPRHEQSKILFITNLVRPFTLSQLKNLLQRTGRISENGFWIDRIKSKCYVIYENEDQAVETRHALHGVTWPVSNPKKLHVDFSTQEEFDKAKSNEETDETPISTIPGTVEDWLREQDLKRERGELDKPWERKSTREWDIGKNEKGKEKEKEKFKRDDRSLEKRRHHTPERSPEPAKKFKKKEEAPAKLLDDLFRKTKTTPCIYWLPLSAETIAVKEEQRRQHMAEHEKRLQELRRTHRRH